MLEYVIPIMILWLDDVRNPTSDKWKPSIQLMASNFREKYSKENDYGQAEIFWVKNFEEFVQYIEDYGVPDIVCLDHDLSEEHYKGNFDDGVKTGYDCAKWFVEYCLNHDIKIPEVISQSMNPSGKENILAYINNARKFQQSERNQQSSSPKPENDY